MGWLCLSRVATQAGCKSFASLPLRKFSICHQFRSNQRPQSGVRTLFNVSLEFLNSRLSGNSGAIGEEAMEAKGFEIKGVHGVEQPRSKWQDVRLLDFFRIFCLSHPSDRDYTLSTLKRQESKFLTFMKKFTCCQLEKLQGISIAHLLEKMEVVWNKILTDLQKRSEDLTFLQREMKFAGVLQLRPSEVGWFEEGKQKFAVSAVCRRKCRGASTLETDLGFQLRLNCVENLNFRFFDLLKWTLLDPAWWGTEHLFSLQGNREQNYNDGEKLLLNFLHF